MICYSQRQGDRIAWERDSAPERHMVRMIPQSAEWRAHDAAAFAGIQDSHVSPLRHDNTLRPDVHVRLRFDTNASAVLILYRDPYKAIIAFVLILWPDSY